MESFLKKEIAEKQELLKWWMEKYDIEIERKSIELKEIKDQLEKDQEWYELLKKRIIEFEQVIEDDKRIKAIAQSRIDLEKLQEQKALQIQKWWRGLRVRRCMGPYKKKKKKKSKEAKGGDEKDKKKWNYLCYSWIIYLFQQFMFEIPHLVGVSNLLFEEYFSKYDLLKWNSVRIQHDKNLFASNSFVISFYYNSLL